MNRLALSLSIFVLCLGAVLARSTNDVFNFQIESEEEALFDLLMNRGMKRATSMRLGKYAFKNCGNTSTEMFNVKSLILGPDPISFPGDFKVSFNGDIVSDVNAPLKAEVLLERRVGSTYIRIPCIGNIGSCTYEDLCSLLAGVTCPPPLVSNHIPCHCPFRKGSYTLPMTTFEVDAAVFPAGDYHARANLTMNGNLVTCIDILASFD